MSAHIRSATCINIPIPPDVPTRFVLIVAPIVALVHMHMDTITKLYGEHAVEILDGEVGQAERQRVYERLHANDVTLKVLIVTPDMLQKQETQEALTATIRLLLVVCFLCTSDMCAKSI